MDSAAREELARRALSFSTADQTEVMVSYEDSALSRFTHDAIHQNVANHDVAVAVRTIVDQRTGVARTNITDDDSLRSAVERAIGMARLTPRDPGVPVLPAGGAVSTPQNAFAAATAQATAQDRARLCGDIFAVAKRDNVWSAGFVTTSASGVTIVNSSGATASFDGTHAGVNVKMNAADSTGFGEQYDSNVSAIDASAAAQTSGSKALNSAGPQTVDPGHWTVILEPAAFGELFMYLADHFSARAFDEGSSFLAGALGSSVLGENVTIRDDYANPLDPSMPFDYEAQPKQRLALIENGVARNIVTDSYYAKKLARENTGHALPAPNAYGPQALSLVVDPGTKSVEQLIAETERGLLVSRFWYIRTVDQKQAIVTGMTRDGTFLIENGKIRGGVRNMRFNQSIIDALRNCEFSNQQRRTGSYSYSCVVPTAKIQGFAFSSGTAF